MNKFHEVFRNKPIIGMLHLFGDEGRLSSFGERWEIKAKKALEELAIFEEEGVDAAIVENYSPTSDFWIVMHTLREISKLPKKY